jgi:hypothetical protein
MNIANLNQLLTEIQLHEFDREFKIELIHILRKELHLSQNRTKQLTELNHELEEIILFAKEENLAKLNECNSNLQYVKTISKQLINGFKANSQSSEIEETIFQVFSSDLDLSDKENSYTNKLENFAIKQLNIEITKQSRMLRELEDNLWESTIAIKELEEKIALLQSKNEQLLTSSAKKEKIILELEQEVSDLDCKNIEEKEKIASMKLSNRKKTIKINSQLFEITTERNYWQKKVMKNLDCSITIIA